MAGRIKRGKPPKKPIKRGRERSTALPELRRDFQDRCAYSMLHADDAGGISCMEVDHFDPRLKKKLVQSYDNLYLAHRPCNRAKTNKPTKAEQRKGLRFLDCCREQDYGTLVFEDPKTHFLVGITKTARWHIEACGLNSNYLVGKRKRRSELQRLFTDSIVQLKRNAQVPEFLALCENLRQQMELLIPPIAPPPVAG